MTNKPGKGRACGDTSPKVPRASGAQRKDESGKAEDATAKAELDGPDIRIDSSDDLSAPRWRIEFPIQLKSFFHKQRDAATARVNAITLGANLDEHKAESVIEAALAFKWVELVEAAVVPLREAARSGMARALLQSNTAKSGDVTDEKGLAAGYALLRAAEMAGMKWEQSILVEDPEAQWALSDITRNRIRTLVVRAFEEKTPITELGERIKQARAFSDANAETIAALEIARAENWGVSVAWSLNQAESAPGNGRELALLYNLPKADRFAVEAEFEIRNHKGPRLAQHLGELEKILADLAKSGVPSPKTQAALNRVLMFLVESLPACYALMDLQCNDRFAIVDHWRRECLHLPARRRDITPRTVVSSYARESYGRLIDPQQYTPALAQVLFERRWMKTMKEIASGTQQDTRQSSVNAYVCGAATKLLEYQRIHEDKEYIDARESGHELISLANTIYQGEGIQRIGMENIPDELSSQASVVDYATMPGPKILRTALRMLHEGYKVGEVAMAIGTDSKHLRQTICRAVEQMAPAQTEALKDWINSREYNSAPYATDLASIVSKLRSARITKLALADTQRPDPTRAKATGQMGMHRQVWVK